MNCLTGLVDGHCLARYVPQRLKMAANRAECQMCGYLKLRSEKNLAKLTIKYFKQGLAGA